jgi:uncharacterized membrane protein YphA (DoxX/SURF4 family)
MPGWKTVASHAAALVVAFLFVTAGVYKAVDPYKFANLAKNLLVPYDLTLPLALLLAVAETTAGVLILVPRFRRWGALLAGILLLAFMGYIGWNYRALIGRDCSCFPELRLPLGIVIDMRRSVGPGFFYGDLAFLATAAIAGFWARKSQGLRTPPLGKAEQLLIVLFRETVVHLRLALRHAGRSLPTRRSYTICYPYAN